MNNDDRTYEAWGLKGGICEARDLKLMLSLDEQIDFLKSKGITFKRCNEKRASYILSERNTFLHIASFRKMFQRHSDGKDAGKYVNLDFADLMYIDSLDTKLRYALLLASLDIERATKASLASRIASNNDEDGYEILAEFMGIQTKKHSNSIARNLELRMFDGADDFTGGLIAHYQNHMPVWVFLEVVPLGTLLSLYLFCADRWDDRKMRQEHMMLTEVKAIRNCCSHGSCILNGLIKGKSSNYENSPIVLKWMTERGIKSSNSRRAKLGNRCTQLVVATLVAFDRLGKQVSVEASSAIHSIGKDIKDCSQRYGQENAFVSYLSFISKVIDSMA